MSNTEEPCEVYEDCAAKEDANEISHTVKKLYEYFYKFSVKDTRRNRINKRGSDQTQSRGKRRLRIRRLYHSFK